MSATIKIESSFPERCDACNQITDEPMVVIKSRCRETGLSLVWIHLAEFEKLVAKAKRKFDKERRGGIEGGEKG